jgi:sugar phosphate isomerase/epimerase
LKISQVVAQLYTLHGLTKTPPEIAKALTRVRKMGYEAVQVSGIGQIEDAELAKMLEGEGLVCAATHDPGDKILSSPQEVVDRLNRLNCEYTAYAYPSGIDLSDPAAIAELARKLDHAGEVLAAGGKTLCYHNHHVEFRKLGGKTIIETIFNSTQPRNLQGEIDTYWVQYGGGDPVAWCRNLRGRLPLIHLKDYMIDSDNKVQFTDVGAGNLDFPTIIREAEESGCRWFIVERDPAPGDPFDSLQASFEYLKTLASA